MTNNRPVPRTISIETKLETAAMYLISDIRDSYGNIHPEKNDETNWISLLEEERDDLEIVMRIFRTMKMDAGNHVIFPEKLTYENLSKYMKHPEKVISEIAYMNSIFYNISPSAVDQDKVDKILDKIITEIATKYNSIIDRIHQLENAKKQIEDNRNDGFESLYSK